MGTDNSQVVASSFQLLDPKIQEQLYQMRWRDLRSIQCQAINYLSRPGGHLVISARTASGKTEAAFLPILSRIIDGCHASVRALYVSPLKALINDQFRRLEQLCQLAGIPVHKWHGDVSAAAKKALREHPSGVLLITPESIESLFVNYRDFLPRVFSQLTFVVIDELHSFLDNERGAHLHSLLSRLIRKSREEVRFVGLSATFGDIEGKQAARKWLAYGANVTTEQIDDETGKVFRLQIRGYLRESQQVKENAKIARDDGQEKSDRWEITGDDERLISDIFGIFAGKSGLIFANNKKQLEFYADLMNRHCERFQFRNQFRVHHGSMSKPEREDTEEALRSVQGTVAFCSSTLEMGIDVGNVTLIGQIGATWSVNSLVQRLGRSGRKDGSSSELRMFIEEDQPTSAMPLVDRLFPSLLQAIATSELLIEGWTEPAVAHGLHASTLVQQVLSVIAENGGARTDQLLHVLVARGAFANVEQPFLLEALQSMLAEDLIEETAEGDWILGLAGEKIVHSKDFYVAFLTGDDFAVVHDGKRIGEIGVMPGGEIDQYLILAGRRWRVIEVDADRKLILVQPARGGRLPTFRASGGPDIHPRVRQKMREVLQGQKIPSYLDAKAQEMLAASRRLAENAGLLRNGFVSEGRDLLWFTWTGTRIQRTILLFMRHMANIGVQDDEITLTFPGSTQGTVLGILKQFLDKPPKAEALAAMVPHKRQEKYEPYLSEALQNVTFARNCLDVGGARALIEEALAYKAGDVG